MSLDGGEGMSEAESVNEQVIWNKRAPCGMIQTVEGRCGVTACNKPLPPRRRRWCSDACGNEWARNHSWTSARHAAKRRDGFRCVRLDEAGERCSGRPLEVNHIEPRRGGGYGNGCHHHLDNLETLCHAHHVVITNEQMGRRNGRQVVDKAKRFMLG